MKTVLISFLLFIWQLPQNMLGAVIALNLGSFDFAGMRFWFWNRRGSVSLGRYRIICDREHIFHEAGHSVQSLILGPAYLIVIGLPSLIWCFLHMHTPLSRVSYTVFYTESWAEKLGERLMNGELSDLRKLI